MSLFWWLLLCFPALLLTYLLLEVWRRRLKNYPPGPIPWPLLGNAVEVYLENPDYPHIAFAKLADKYGPIIGLGMGVHYTVVISSFDLIKEVIIKPEVGARYLMPFATDRAWGKRNMGIGWNNGDSWQELRRFTVRTLREFGYGKQSAMEHILQEEVTSLATLLSSRAKEGTILIDNVDIATSTINVLWGLVAGCRFAAGDDRVRRSIHFNEEYMHIVGYSNVYNPYPFLRRLFPEWSGFNSHCRVYREYSSFMRGIIDDVRSSRKNEEGAADSFIGRFLEVLERRSTRENEKDYTEDQLTLILTDLFLAGSETISTMTIWMILFLTKNPDKQATLYQEIVEVIGTGRLPSLDDETRMPYTRACILEALRMGNVAPLMVPRTALTSFQVGGYTIPQGAMVAFALHPVFGDKTYWGDPSAYRPERFLEKGCDEKLQLVPERADRISLAFGGGRRSCMADSFSMRSLFMYTTILFGKFQFSTIPGMEPSEVPRPKNLTQLPFNFHVQLKVRNTMQ